MYFLCYYKSSSVSLQANIMEYHRYLKEVVQALESDADFRSKLEKANEADIRVSIIVV